MNKHPNNLRALREARGLSQQQLADRVVPATTSQQVSRLELGSRKLSLDWMMRLALALGCDPSELIPSEVGAALAPDEKALVAIYRSLSERERTLLLSQLNLLTSR